MTSKPAISVVIPAYNSTRFLETTLQSVLSQTLAPAEIIIVDDESRDATVEMVEQFCRQSSLIKLVRQSNAGTQAARNNGIRHSTGDFIALLDHDDCWLPDYLAQLVPFRASHRIAFSNYQLINGEGKITDRHKHIRGAEMQLPQLLFGNQIFLSGALFSRQLWDEIGPFDESLVGAGDWDWLLRAVIAGAEVYHVQKVLWQYRVHSTNTTRNVKLMTEDALQILEKTFGNRNLPKSLQRYKSYAFYINYVIGAGKFYAVNDQIRAEQYLKQARQASFANFFSLQTFISFLKIYTITGNFDLLQTGEEAARFVVNQARNQAERRILSALALLTLALLSARQKPAHLLAQPLQAIRQYPLLLVYPGVYRTALRYSSIYFREASNRVRRIRLS